MTVSSSTNVVRYPGRGSVGPFAIPFRLLDESDARVIRQSADGGDTLLALGVDYSISGASDFHGTLTLTSALTSGETLVVRRAPALVQPAAIDKGGGASTTAENALDRLLMQVQSVKYQADRSIRLRESDDASLYELELAPGADGQVVAWSGGGLVNRALSSGVVLDSVFNPLNYGAAGTGLVNDAPALNTLANATVPATGGTILFPPGTYRISSSFSFPSHVTVALLAGAKLSIDSGVSVRIEGSFDAPLMQCFAGAGGVRFGERTTVINAEWWTTNATPGTTDMASALMKAIGSVPVNRGATIPVRGYAIGSTVTIQQRPIRLQGSGWGLTASAGGSYLKWIGSAGSPMLKVLDCQGAHLDNFRFIGKSTAKPSAGLSHYDSNSGSPNGYNCYSRLYFGWAGWDPADQNTQMDVGVLIDGAGVGNDSNNWDMIVTYGCAIGVHVTGSQYLFQHFAGLFCWRSSIAAVKTKANLTGSNWFFALNAVDIWTYDESERPSIDVTGFGSESSGRLLLLGAGGVAKISNAYWQAREGYINPDGAFIKGAGTVCHSVILDSFSLTSHAGSPPRRPPQISLKGTGTNEVKNVLKISGQSNGITAANLDITPINFTNNYAVLEFEEFGAVGASAPKRVRNYLAANEAPDFNRYDIELPVRFLQATNAVVAVGSGGSAPAFTNRWANYDTANYASASYWRDANGIVHLRGQVKDGAIGSAAFTLPVGYRPLKRRIFSTVANGLFAAVLVRDDGQVIPQTGSNAIFSLDGIAFETT